MRKHIRAILLFLIVVLYAGGYKEASAVENNSVAITKENFPDKRIREKISKEFDKNKDMILSEEEIKAANKLDLGESYFWEKGTFNLQGISKLKYVTTLTVGADIIKNISEIQKMTQLVVLKVSPLRGNTDMLDFSKNVNLKELEVYADIKKLRLPKSKNLQSLSLEACKIRELILNGFVNLRKVKLKTNDFKTFTINNCPKLEKISSTENEKIEKVILKKLPKLGCLKIGSSKKFKKLKLPQLSEMRELVLGRNSIKKIDFKKMPNLRILSVKRNNKITKLDLRPLRKLHEFTWQRGKLRKIRFGQKKNLEHMYLQHNRLGGTWKLSKFPRLDEFYCNYNRIKNIYARNHEYLDVIECGYNRLRKLDLYNIEPTIIWFKGNPHVTAYLLHDSSSHNVYYRFDKSAKVHYKWKD